MRYETFVLISAPHWLAARSEYRVKLGTQVPVELELQTCAGK